MIQNEQSPALVTGASSGIGLALAKRLIEQGVETVGLARDFSKTKCTGLEFVELDLADLDQLRQSLESDLVLKQMFKLMVLNAGYGRFGGIEQFSYQQIQHLVNTNLVSKLFLLKHYLPLMKRSGGGDIVLVGSESALQGAKAGAIYCATKFALRGLAQSLRADCATANIRVMLVNPGPVDSDFFNELDFGPQAGREFSIDTNAVADSILHALAQPRNVVLDEINMQPLKRSFKKR